MQQKTMEATTRAKLLKRAGCHVERDVENREEAVKRITASDREKALDRQAFLRSIAPKSR
jgi:hypothetical protein